jgi:PAS domain S-box-containing protein
LPDVRDPVVAAVAQADDASRLRQLEASLRERELQLEEANRIANLGTWSWERSTNATSWSDEIYAIFGRTRETYTPRSVTELRNLPNVPATWLHMLDLHQRAIDTGEPYEADIEIERSDGSKRWIVSRGQPARWENGQVVALRGTVQDITDRKLNELALAERERQLVEAQRIARIGTWRWDRTTDITTWSEEVYHAFGFDPAQPAPNYEVIRSLHPPTSRLRLEAAVQRALTDSTPYAHDVELQLPDGSTRWIVARGEVESYRDGQPAVLRGTIQDITERKLSELALQQREADLLESQTRFQRLYESDLMGIGFPNAEGAILDCNDTLLHTIGYTRQDLDAGLVRWDLMTPPEFREVDLAHILESRSRGSCTPYRKEYLRKDGSRVPVMIGFATLEGDKAGSIGFVLDLTAQQQAEDAFRETRSRFEKLYAANLLGICYPDKFGAFYDGNDEFLRIVGYTRQELHAGLVRWDNMTPPEYAQLDAEHIAEAARTGSCRPYEKEYIRKDGVRVPIVCGYALLEGSADNYIGFVLDLTQQKQAETAIREREQRFSALAESLPQLVWASAPNGDRLYVNSRYCEYTGMTADDLVGARWRDYLHPDDIPHTNDLWYASMASGQDYSNEYRIRRHDGMYRSFLARAVAVRNPDGTIERWLGSATDIHDQKLAEEALRRTEKLAATGRLAASIAHEINNPLEAVTNALYLALMDTSLRQDTRSFLKIAEQELARVAQVTTQTLRFHRQSVAATSVDLAEIMDSAFSLFAPRFEACHIEVHRDYTPGQLLYCRADELRQVFANFLSNALDATRQGGRVRIRIHASRDCGPADCPGIRVSIADTGHGVPVHLRRSIFEPFISTKDATGTGLGLWVSEGIVQKHKGRISLRSRTDAPHQGTVFSLFFPLDGIEPTTPPR